MHSAAKRYVGKKAAAALLALVAAVSAQEAVAAVGYVACVYNGTGQDVNYSWRSCTDFNDGDQKCSEEWDRSELDADHYNTLYVSPPDDIDDVDGWFDARARVRIEVDFDSSYDEGYQKQRYAVDTTKERDYVDSERCDPNQKTYRFYHFKKVSNGLDLFHD